MEKDAAVAGPRASATSSAASATTRQRDPLGASGSGAEQRDLVADAISAGAARMNESIEKLEALSKRLAAAISMKKRAPNPAIEGPGHDFYLKAGAAFWNELSDNPARIFEAQINYWGEALRHYVSAQQALAQGRFEPPQDTGPKDRRFSNPLWETHPYFNFVKQQYLIGAKAVEEAVQSIEGIGRDDRRRVEYFTRQIVDMMAPTNFLATNPDALERAVETDGESLVQGLENLVRDIEANHGDLVVTLSDPTAFEVGRNIGAAEGSVVFRNDLIELIQYAPKTETVHRRPLVIFPPWINKFYILDLKPANSLIRWIVEQGYTLFVVSWKNPDAAYAGKGIDDYVQDGYLAAIEEVKAITGEETVNAVGYCIAGTMLAVTLALLAKRGDASVNAATFLTTLTDFADMGEFTAFLQDDFLSGIEAQVKQDGVLASYYMTRTFSFLRANDLIYQPAIRSYMMGEAPPAFDLLYWNGDGTNLPAKMAVEYLRNLCQGDQFASKGFSVLGERVRISEVTTPLCAVACETDHIAPWLASFDGVAQMGAEEKTFILSQSGHVAGIVNPPSKKKYGHYTADAPVERADDWREAATFIEGSWWPSWGAWLSARSGEMVPARVPGEGGRPVLGPAPGRYVLERPLPAPGAGAGAAAAAAQGVLQEEGKG